MGKWICSGDIVWSVNWCNILEGALSMFVMLTGTNSAIPHPDINTKGSTPVHKVGGRRAAGVFIPLFLPFQVGSGYLN